MSSPAKYKKQEWDNDISHCRYCNAKLPNPDAPGLRFYERHFHTQFCGISWALEKISSENNSAPPSTSAETTMPETAKPQLQPLSLRKPLLTELVATLQRHPAEINEQEADKPITGPLVHDVLAALERLGYSEEAIRLGFKKICNNGQIRKLPRLWGLYFLDLFTGVIRNASDQHFEPVPP